MATNSPTTVRSHIGASCRRRKVLFSEESTTIEPSPPCQCKSEISAMMWFSTEDTIRHRNILIQDVREAKRLMENTPTQDLIQSHISMFLGIEMFLSPDFSRQSLTDKRRHISMIIAQQARLQEEDLCELSALSSRMARERAHASAVTYWNMSKPTGTRQGRSQAQERS